jgi:hypothetical protein
MALSERALLESLIAEMQARSAQERWRCAAHRLRVAQEMSLRTALGQLMRLRARRSVAQERFRGSAKGPRLGAAQEPPRRRARALLSLLARECSSVAPELWPAVREPSVAVRPWAAERLARQSWAARHRQAMQHLEPHLVRNLSCLQAQVSAVQVAAGRSHRPWAGRPSRHAPAPPDALRGTTRA